MVSCHQLINDIQRSNETILIGNDTIAYELLRSKKRNRSIALKIRKDQGIQINCPHDTPMSVIESFLIRKHDWIQRNLAAQLDRPTAIVPHFENGAKHHYKGHPYTLVLANGKKNYVMLKDQQLYLFHRHNADKSRIMKSWYRQQALSELSERTLLLAQRHQLPTIKSIKVRYMKTMWGSCSNDAIITYNIHLIKASQDLIDYVIIHELCHLIHHNHSHQFYQLQSQMNPNWKTHKYQLNQLSIIH